MRFHIPICLNRKKTYTSQNNHDALPGQQQPILTPYASSPPHWIQAQIGSCVCRLCGIPRHIPLLQSQNPPLPRRHEQLLLPWSCLYLSNVSVRAVRTAMRSEQDGGHLLCSGQRSTAPFLMRKYLAVVLQADRADVRVWIGFDVKGVEVQVDFQRTTQEERQRRDFWFFGLICS